MYESSSNYVSEVFLSKKQAIAIIGFRPGFAPKGEVNWAKIKISPVESSACNSRMVWSEKAETLPSGYLNPFFELAHFHRNWVTAPTSTGICMQNVTKSAISPNTGARQSQDPSGFMNGL